MQFSLLWLLTVDVVTPHSAVSDQHNFYLNVQLLAINRV